MKSFRKLIAIILTALAISALSLTVVHAEDEKTSLAGIYRDHTSYTMVASRKGYFRYAPENSLKAIHSAENSGADIIEIDVRSTADGTLILMDDETVTRTCYGYGENTVVSEMTYNEISKLNLLMGKGGANAEKTQETVPTLEEVFKDRKMSYLASSQYPTEQKALFLIDADWSLRDKICKLVTENGMQNEVIFYIDDASTDEIATWKASLPFEPMVMTYFKGNVIFAATANVKNDSEIAEGIHLATKNPYGVIFGKTVQNKAYESGIRTMAAPCNPGICGTQIQDTEVYWDYLVSKGFNIILTDNVEELRSYVDRSNNKALELDWACNMYIHQWKLPDFSSDKFLDYKRAYTNASEKAEGLLKNDMSRSYNDIVSAIHELKKAYDDINANYNELAQGTAGMTVTPVRILLCVLTVAVVVCAEIYVYKKKKKS